MRSHGAIIGKPACITNSTHSMVSACAAGTFPMFWNAVHERPRRIFSARWNFLLAGCLDDPADFQAVASLTVEHSIVAHGGPSSGSRNRGRSPAQSSVGSELLEGFSETAQIAAGLVLTKPLGSVLASLFEVSGGFGAEDRTTPHTP